MLSSRPSVLGLRSPIAAPAVLLVLLAFAAPALAQPPSFDKSFAPATVAPGNLSALTFEITAVDAVTDLGFSDDLPAGLTFADPVSLVLGSGCDPATSVDFPDADSLSFLSPRLGAGVTCTVRVDVQGGAPGEYANVSGDLTSSAGNSGSASATLEVAADLLRVGKSFTPGEVAPGGTSRLVIDLANLSDFPVDGISFSDFLPVGMTVAASPNVAEDCNATLSAPAESGSVTPGADSLSYAGGSLAAGADCSIALDVTVGAAGSYVNRSEEVLVGVGGTSVGFASAELDASLAPLDLSKVFVDPVPPGATTDLTFTLVNSTRDTVTGIAFTDDLDATLSGLQVTGATPLVPCGTGSSVSGTSVIDFSGGNLESGESCSFTLSVEVPAGAAPGTYPNITSDVTSSAGTFPAAGDDLDVGFAPGMLKLFCEPGGTAADPCTPVSQVTGGDVVTARFVVANPDPENTLTGLTFQDDFDAFLSGVEVSPDSQSGVCGAGSSFADADGTDPGEVFQLTAGTLGPEESCTFQVDVQLPPSVAPGTYVNQTTPVQGFSAGEPVSGNAGIAAVTRGLAPVLSKSFADPVAPGDTVDLVFTLDASESTEDFTGISFSDDLDATLTGLSLTSVPLSACGGTLSSGAGGGSVSLSGASVAAGDTCSFSLPLSVPVDAAGGSYPNTTSTVSALADGEPVSGDPATDDLDVIDSAFVKEFVDDPVSPGGTVTLSFSLFNASDLALSDLTFSDDLEAVLAGLTPADLPRSDVCGAGSQLSFAAGTLTFSGGSLAARSVCTFSTVLQVPATAATGSYGNVTSAIEGTLGDNPFTGPTASDTLVVGTPLSLTKSFAGPATRGGTVELVFSLVAGPDFEVSEISFSDGLGAVLFGLTAVDLPADGFCGPGSMITGTEVLAVTGANLAAGSSCTFSVILRVPSGASPGSYTNTTSTVTALLAGDSPATAPPAMADLVVEEVEVDDIPTLDFLGLLALIGLLGAFGAFRLRG